MLRPRKWEERDHETKSCGTWLSALERRTPHCLSAVLKRREAELGALPVGATLQRLRGCVRVGGKCSPHAAWASPHSVSLPPHQHLPSLQGVPTLANTLGSHHALRGKYGPSTLSAVAALLSVGTLVTQYSKSSAHSCTRGGVVVGGARVHVGDAG